MSFLKWLIPVDEKTPNVTFIIKGQEQKRKAKRELRKLEIPKYDLGKAFDKLKKTL